MIELDTMEEQQTSEPSEARPGTKSPPEPRDRRGSPPSVAALRMESITLWVIGRVEQFPRTHRFTIGDRWIETCLDIQTSLVEATYLRDKRALLLSASRGLVRARVLARMAASLHCISLNQEAHFTKESTEVGRMIGGWLRSVSQRPRTSNVGTEAAP